MEPRTAPIRQKIRIASFVLLFFGALSYQASADEHDPTRKLSAHKTPDILHDTRLFDDPRFMHDLTKSIPDAVETITFLNISGSGIKCNVRGNYLGNAEVDIAPGYTLEIGPRYSFEMETATTVSPSRLKLKCPDVSGGAEFDGFQSGKRYVFLRDDDHKLKLVEVVAGVRER